MQTRTQKLTAWNVVYSQDKHTNLIVTSVASSREWAISHAQDKLADAGIQAGTLMEVYKQPRERAGIRLVRF